MFRITRTAWETSRVSYDIDITEQDIIDWNESIKYQNPDFVDLTEEDILDAWTGEESDESRYNEKIWWYNCQVYLFDLIRDDINDRLWAQRPCIEYSQTDNWEDEYHYVEEW